MKITPSEKTNIVNSKKNVKIYNLDMIIAVGYRVNSKKATNFRIWATKVLKEYLITGVVMDYEEYQVMTRFMYPNPKILKLEREKVNGRI